MNEGYAAEPCCNQPWQCASKCVYKNAWYKVWRDNPVDSVDTTECPTTCPPDYAFDRIRTAADTASREALDAKMARVRAKEQEDAARQYAQYELLLDEQRKRLHVDSHFQMLSARATIAKLREELRELRAAIAELP